MSAWWRLGKTVSCGSQRTADSGRRDRADDEAREVILKAAAGKLKWWEAAEIMGVTDRTMRRWRERLNEEGYSGLWVYRKQSELQTSSDEDRGAGAATVSGKVLRLQRAAFHEKLRELHGIEMSYTWVKTALQTAGW